MGAAGGGAVDVKLKRPRRFSLLATLVAFAVGLVATLGVLWLADRPSPGPGSGATATTATSPTTPATSRPGDTATGAATEGRSASTESATTPSAPTPVVRLQDFYTRTDGANTALVWELSAPLGGAAVRAETASGVTVRIRKVDGAWEAVVSVASGVISGPLADGSSVEFSIPTEAFGDLPVEITPGVIAEGASDVVTGKPVTLG